MVELERKKSIFIRKRQKMAKIIERIIKIQIHITFQKITKSKQKCAEFINRKQEKKKHFKSEIKRQKFRI